MGIKIEDTEGDTGVKITGIEENSVAEKAGLKQNDIITEVDNNKVNGVDDVRSKLMEIRDKMVYTLKVRRDGSERTVTINIPKVKKNAEL